MIPPFEFATAHQIIFGTGVSIRLVELTRSLGRRAFVVLGSRHPTMTDLANELDKVGLLAAQSAVASEPTVPLILELTGQAKQAGADVIVAIGGGSALDAGKAVAAFLTNQGDPLDYLEVVGKGLPLARPAAPIIALPTTAGTGAEVTRNAVLAVPARQVKVSLRHASLLPRIALVDPLLTHSLPPAVTASTGLDALTQCIEPFVSNMASPLTDAVAREGMRRAATALRRAVADGNDAAARADMALASLCGGLALANAKLGAVHGFAGVLGGIAPIPHGVVCARLLPVVFAANVQVLQDNHDPDGYLPRFDEVARILTGNLRAVAADGVEWISALCTDLHIPGLRTFGIHPDQFDAIIAKSQTSSSMKGNPVRLSNDQLAAILHQAS